MSMPQGAPPLTIAVLERAAATYLERYASSAENLRHVLMRRVAKAARHDADQAAEGQALVDALIERYLGAGLLNDGHYAEHRAAGLARGGASRYRIRGKLRQKGVARDQIDQAIATLEERGEGSETAAARAFIRKKRLGPYRAPDTRAAFRQKDVAALVRVGFALDLARRLLAAPDVEGLDAIAGEDR